VRLLQLLVVAVMLGSTTLPALADAVPVSIVSATGVGPKTVRLVVKTSPNAACEAREDVTINRSLQHVSLGQGTAGDDGTATWTIRFEYNGTRHVTVTCKVGNDEGSASTDVRVQ